jgi:hypothetical protein
MLPFPVHTHKTIAGHAPISPPTMAKVALTHASPTQSFWSLVIDNNAPHAPIRAGITLHWVLKDEPISKSMFGNDFDGQFRKLALKNSWFKKPISFKKLIAELKNNKIISKDRIMISLRKLLGTLWQEI